MLFPEFTKNQNPTKYDQIRPNTTKSDQIRPNLVDSDRIRRSDSVGVAPGGGTCVRNLMHDQFNKGLNYKLTIFVTSKVFYYCQVFGCSEYAFHSDQLVEAAIQHLNVPLSTHETTFKVCTANVPSTHCSLYILFKKSPVLAQNFSSILIQRIVRIWLQKQVLDAINNRIYGKHWFPIFSQNVQANISF